MTDGCGLKLVHTLEGLAAVGAGAYHGFCDAKGLPVSNEMLLIAGPTALRAATDGLVGMLGVGSMAAGEAMDSYASARETVWEGAKGAAFGAASGATIGGVIGGVQTGVGYVLGYGAGVIMR